MNAQTRGKHSEAAVITELLERGIDVAIPFGTSEGYDIVAFTNDGWKTIQVKTARWRTDSKNGAITCIILKGNDSNTKYGHGDFDFLIAAMPSEKRFWVFTFDEVIKKSKITMNLQMDSRWELLG